MNLKIVVINYFSADKTIQLIEKINQTTLTNTHYSIVCADNSNDKTQHDLLSKYKKECDQELNLIFNNDNLGFGKAINQAVGNSSFDRLLLINPDVTLLEGALDNLLKASLNQPHQGIWGGITVLNNKQQDFRHAWREPTLLRTFTWAIGLKRLFNMPLIIDDYANQNKQCLPYPVDIISGCCMLISYDAWNDTNGFDERFFLYSEEFDLCKRSRDKNYQPTVIPGCKIEHEVSYTSDNSTRLSVLFNSKFGYIEKHHNLIYTLSYRLIISIGALIRSFAFFIKLQPNKANSWLTVLCNSFKKIKAAEYTQLLKVTED